MDGMMRTDPPLEALVRLIGIAATHVLRDSKGTVWRIGGYGDRGLKLVSENRSIHVQRLDGFAVERICESPDSKNDSQTNLRGVDEAQRSEG